MASFHLSSSSGMPRNSNYSPEVITEARPNKGQALLRQHAQDAQLGLDTTGSPRSLPVLLLRQPYPNRGPEQSGNYFGLTCIPVELKLMQCQIEKGRRIRSGDNMTCNRKQESERTIRRMFPAHSLGSSGAQGLLARYHAESVWEGSLCKLGVGSGLLLDEGAEATVAITTRPRRQTRSNRP